MCLDKSLFSLIVGTVGVLPGLEKTFDRPQYMRPRISTVMDSAAARDTTVDWGLESGRAAPPATF